MDTLKDKMEWRELPNFSRYKFSSCGEVYDTKTKALRNKTKSGKPQYYYVHLVPDDTQVRSLFRLHRLTAKAWVKNTNPEIYDMVDHIDQDKFNNHKDNLRWVCRILNQRNTKSNVWVKYHGFTVFMKDIVSHLYPSDVAAYGWFCKKCKSADIEITELIPEFDSRYAREDQEVLWHGKYRSLRGLCEEHGTEFEKTKKLMSMGYNQYYAVVHDKTNRLSVDIKTDSGTFIHFRSKACLYFDLGKPYDLCNKLLSEGMTYEQIKAWIPEPVIRIPKVNLIEIDGVSKTRSEWISYYETSESRVASNQTKYKLTFIEALKVPVTRVSYLKINGERVRVSDFSKSLGITPWKVTTYKSKHKVTFKETYQHFGVDMSMYDIEVM